MELQRIVPILTVPDTPVAVHEHIQVLGMHVVMDMEWIVFLADDAGHQLGLITQDATAAINPDVSVFLEDVEAVEASHRQAADAGLTIVHPLSDEPWGVTRFFYRDSSGHVINVGTHR
jgi:uncharacterized glyoxalase superfamily protein PhnB